MPGYDFTTLSPDDFEIFACDLLRAHHNIEFKGFRRGPDGGVDLVATIESGKFVVQCKHYQGSSFSELRRSARAEKLNMDGQKPARYLFVTTQDLTLGQQLQLVEDLRPWINNVNQIIAQRDLNTLLTENPSVERAHFKLWMASTSVLDAIIRSGVWVRSSALMEEIQERVKRFVFNECFTKAERMLHTKGVCVIVGAPGVGKSMIADMLSLVHWHDGWEIVTLESHELSKCWDAWRPDTRQLFYLDDVFGQTDLRERLSRDSGSHLARLIGRVGRSEDKRVIITTRTHILREAQMRDENVERSGLNARQCVVRVTDYGFIQKARILYNHLYFSKLNRDIVREFVQARHYHTVIKHPNFTPRLIEQSILQYSSEESTESLFVRAQAVLDRPVLLWGTSFRESLNELSRLILIQIALGPLWGVDINELRTSMVDPATPLEFTSSLRLLESSWIQILQSDAFASPRVKFNDPSCRDFVLAFLDSEPDYAIAALSRTSSIESVIVLLGYCAAVSEGKLKYLGLRDKTSTNIETVESVVDRAWRQRLPSNVAQDLSVLGRLQGALATFDHPVANWLIEDALNQDVGEDDYPTLDALRLLNFISRRGLSLTLNQIRGCAVMVRMLAEYSINEEGENLWSELNEVILWMQQWLPAEEIEACKDSLGTGYAHWLDNEFDSILQNAASIREAEDWVGAAETEAWQIFGGQRFADEFSYFAQRLADRFEEFDSASYYAEYGRSRATLGGSAAVIAQQIERSDDQSDDLRSQELRVDQLFRLLE